MYTPTTYALNNNISLYFTDSGPPPSSTDYTTLVILHGTAFSGGKFLKFPIFIYYSEIDDLVNGRKVFLDNLGILLADFLRTFIEKEKIPEVDFQSKSGGLVILGWSAGNITGMSMFTDPSLLDEKVYRLLERYLREMVIYDPAYSVFGYPPPQVPGLYNPFFDPDFKGTPEEKFRNFAYWVASYYDHDSSRGPAGYDFRKLTDDNSLANWSEEDFNKYFCVDAAIRSEQTRGPAIQKTLRDCKDRVLFDADIAAKLFPNMRVSYLSASRSVWFNFFAANETERIFRDQIKTGQKENVGRWINFTVLEGANHFLHQEDPERFMEIVKETLLLPALEDTRVVYV
ncbi:hypothetical protein VKT23_009928 [Stygiomarasmius scandens]|uniref:AB hydrolase-1 domain-containing protein n=1 Tax=Marasmiellus scandens TaxID=2682957 RepID=A0ABR1JCJ5_9AGAR